MTFYGPKNLPRGYLGYWEHFWLFWIFSKKNRKKIWNSFLKNDPFWLEICSSSTCFGYNSSRKSRKNLKSMSNESYDPGEHFWPPICMYRSTFVEVTAQKMSKTRIFGVFLGSKNRLFLEGSKIQIEVLKFFAIFFRKNPKKPKMLPVP